MGFRFQKRIKLLPGVTVNLSKSGVSTSIGTTGARVTYGHKKRRTTVGLPGTGISHTTIKSTGKADGTSKDETEYMGAFGIVLWTLFACFLIALFF